MNITFTPALIRCGVARPARRLILASLVIAYSTTALHSVCCADEPLPVRPIRVACVGDSITFGHLLSNRDQESYPANLAILLGDRWEVKNFGKNGATVLKKGNRPYYKQQEFVDAHIFNPDVVVLILGTNDTQCANWQQHKQEFSADYRDLMESFLEANSHLRFIACLPVPLFRDKGHDWDTDQILHQEIIPQIKHVAAAKEVLVLDLYSRFDRQANLFPDGVHPNAAGAKQIAEYVYDAIEPGISPVSTTMKPTQQQ